MEERESGEIVYRQILPLFESDWLKECAFGDEFCNEWKRVLRNAARNDQPYPPETPGAVFPVYHLFWMDCCILIENQPKLKPDRLRPLLHIFRRPSMLTLKELL